MQETSPQKCAQEETGRGETVGLLLASNLTGQVETKMVSGSGTESDSSFQCLIQDPSSTL